MVFITSENQCQMNTLKMSIKTLVQNTFDNTLHTFRAFEECQRKDGEDILDFFNRWKNAYKMTEQNGCWMNDTVLALKLLSAAGLEENSAIKVLNSSGSMRLDLIMSTMWNLERGPDDDSGGELGLKCPFCEMGFLDTESGLRESVRVHLGENHMEEELLGAVEDRFGKEGSADHCVDCPGIRLDTDHLRREHLLEAHPWVQLSSLEEQVCGNVQAEEDTGFNEDIGILSKLTGITVARTLSTKRNRTYSKLEGKNIKRLKENSLGPEYLVTQDCILCNVTEGKKMNTVKMLLHYSGCLFERGYFFNIIDPGSDNLNEQGLVRDVFGKVFRYKCNEESCPKFMACQDKCRTVKCRTDCKNSMGFKEFCIHTATHHNVLELVLWQALPELPGLMVVVKAIQSSKRTDEIERKVLPPQFTRVELHTCLLCEGREKEGERLLLDSRDFRLVKYHYASCFFPTGVYLNLYPPGKVNMVGPEVRDLLGREVTYACNRCEKRNKRMGYKAFAIHMASEHGGLDMVMLLDKRKEVRRFARRIGLGNDQSTEWWQGMRQLDQFRRRNERLQKSLIGAKNDQNAASSVILGMKQLWEEVAWSDTDGGAELMARKEEMLTEMDNLVEANMINTEEC